MGSTMLDKGTNGINITEFPNNKNRLFTEMILNKVLASKSRLEWLALLLKYYKVILKAINLFSNVT